LSFFGCVNARFAARGRLRDVIVPVGRCLATSCVTGATVGALWGGEGFSHPVSLVFVCPPHVITASKPLCPLASSGSEPRAVPLSHPCCLPPPSPASAEGIPWETSPLLAPWVAQPFLAPQLGMVTARSPPCRCPAFPGPHGRCVPRRDQPAASGPRSPASASSRHSSRRLGGPGLGGLKARGLVLLAAWREATGSLGQENAFGGDLAPPRPSTAVHPLPKSTDLSFLSSCWSGKKGHG